MWQLAVIGYVVMLIVGLFACTIAISGLHSLLTGEPHLLSRIDIESVTE